MMQPASPQATTSAIGALAPVVPRNPIGIMPNAAHHHVRQRRLRGWAMGILRHRDVNPAGGPRADEPPDHEWIVGMLRRSSFFLSFRAGLGKILVGSLLCGA
jgi:hypothetical protein